jgi:hypothetical protein
MPGEKFSLDPGDVRQLAASLFNHVWDLLESPTAPSPMTTR